MADDLIATKLVNALVPTAEPQPSIPITPITAYVLSRFKSKHNGLWVGGSLQLTSASLVFKPNKLNEAIHKAGTSRAIKLVEVIDVQDRFGLVTRIVDVICRNEPTFTFRCYGASNFAQFIKTQSATMKTA